MSGTIGNGASGVELPAVVDDPNGWEEPSPRERLHRTLAEQFAKAVERLAGSVPVERRAEWLVMAARLVQPWARLPFPGNASGGGGRATPAERAGVDSGHGGLAA